MKLDDELQKIHERYWENEVQASRNMSVVLVEGDDDRDVLEEVFKSRSRTWAVRVRIVVAGGRKQVLERMKSTSTFPRAYGLVDRDTWTDEEVAQHCREARLLVTEGWCLENVFFDPSVTSHYGESVTRLLSEQRERWIRAGALWWTLQRTREAQQRWQDALGWSYGSPRDDIELGSTEALVESLGRRIPEALRREARLDIDAIAEGFEKRLDEVLRLPEAMQWRVGVHGKCAFNGLLLPTLQAIHGSQDHRVTLASKIGRPAPLDALVAVLFP